MNPEKITAKELAALLQGGSRQVTVVDVRDKARFAAGHVPGALHIPLAKLGEKKDELPKDHLIITYCGGGVSGPKGAALLAEAGFNAKVMEGFRAWQSQGLPVETE